MGANVDPSSRTVLLERPADRVALVRLHRPEALNALSTRLAEDLIEALGEIGGDRSVRVAILTGSGDRAFCAGADLKERQGMTPEQWHHQHAIFEAAFAALRDFAKPIFAAVNGIAAGGGCELALNTDFMIAAEGARFGQPEVRLGIMPGGGGTQLLPRRVPLGWARQLLESGELIDAETALRIGLVNSLHPPAELLSCRWPRRSTRSSGTTGGWSITLIDTRASAPSMSAGRRCSTTRSDARPGHLTQV